MGLFTLPRSLNMTILVLMAKWFKMRIAKKSLAKRWSPIQKKR